MVGRRVAQAALDHLLIGSAVLAMTVPALVGVLYLESRGVERTTAAYLVGAVLFAAGTAADWFVLAWWPHRHGGRTPAMRRLGLRVLTETGEAPRLRAHTLRWLLGVVDFACYGLVGLAVMLCTPQRQRLGDLVARTVVVRAPVRR